ncbi:MAG: isocitrate/isopropylmalate dehydrogenase family protein [Methanothrix sp.]|uniref:3-isopropylmalate dehydrogenase n=1 Tax=Methanothrix thermoacetophila (strain DSM 6194 / JCM 14653 / NBRC 101360 / PT) TaxID=349307 RepID=A0B554_METTP|nr:MULTISPECIES: isocitrate/isopropylmalate dehydrogenase family protein [Methanothrix]ABK13828.1 3-isopropylmalate dehydrogenase [Methanothrix thermoacetophila PT]MBC7079997.1 isocitrate/isopropylmalate dehydrogenase family protein [Methanothrix sp.]NPU88146.1 isocitrate/isopropylmalate dehydrogenase family protein [Methanothrix sp.]
MIYKVPVIPGDGIGPEIIAEGRKVLETAADKHGFDIEWIEYPLGADHYLRTGELVSEETLKELGRYRAIYLGAIGDPRVKPGVLEKGILLAMRFYFDQYINLRPVKLLEGVWTPLKDKGPKDIDFVVVRENTEDFYIGQGGRARSGRSHADLEVKRSLYNVKFGLDIDSDSDEIAYQIGMVSREGCTRVIKYAFDLAMERRKHVSSVDKANVLSDIYGFWREIFEDVGKSYPEVTTDFNFVDAITMWFVKNPEWFDVVVAPNMFGDIITDLGAMIQGGLGLAPGANLNPEGTSMFEPIHGSAPKYKGMNKINPIATIWAGAMLLEHLGEKEAAQDVVRAIELSLREGRVRTYDLGGSSTTSEVGDEIARLVRNL